MRNTLTQDAKYLNQIIQEEKGNSLRTFVREIDITIPEDYDNLPYNSCIEKTIKNNANNLETLRVLALNNSKDFKHIFINLYLYSFGLEKTCENLEIKYNENMFKSKNDFNELLSINGKLVQTNKNLSNEIRQKDNKLNKFVYLSVLSNLLLAFYLITGLKTLILHINYTCQISYQIFDLLCQGAYWIFLNLNNFDYNSLRYHHYSILLAMFIFSLLSLCWIRKRKQE